MQMSTYGIEIIFLLVFHFHSAIISVSAEEWIDPHDMNINSIRTLKKPTVPDIKDNIVKSTDKDGEVKKEIAEETTTVYLKRVVSMILNFPTADDVGQNTLSGKYVLDTDSDNYRFLLEFVQKEKINTEDLRNLDSILSNTFSRKLSDDLLIFISSSKQTIFSSLFSVQTLTLLSACLGLYIVYNLLRSDFSFLYIFRYFLTILLITDYAFRYTKLYEEVEEHNSKVQYSDQCDAKKMNWKEYFIFLTDRRHCEMLHITPLEVALSQVRHIIIIPMSAMGTGMGNFGSELWKNLPAPWNFLIFPVMLIFVLLLAAILIPMISKTDFKFNLFHMIHLEYGKKADNSDRLSGATLDRLIDCVRDHRPMVQDLSPAAGPNNRKPRKQIKQKSPSPPKANVAVSPKDERAKKGKDGAKPTESLKTPSKSDGEGSGGASVEKSNSKMKRLSSTPNVSSGSMKDSKD